MSAKDHQCAQCGTPIKGRVDKKFCDDNCRNTWHNEHNKETVQIVREVNKILKRNRRILEKLNTTGKTKVHKNELLKQGFDFSLYTSIFTSNTNKTYFFCYEHGYLPLEANYYILVISSLYKNQTNG